MNSTTTERTIQLSTDTILNNVAAFLMATRTIKEDDEVLSVSFDPNNKTLANIVVKETRETKKDNDEHDELK